MVRKLFLKRSHQLQERSIDALARHVADVSVEEVVRNVAERTCGMSVNEACGYVRARAAKEIRRQSGLAIRRYPGADDSWVADVIDRATHRVVPLAVRAIATGIRVEHSYFRHAA